MSKSPASTDAALSRRNCLRLAGGGILLAAMPLLPRPGLAGQAGTWRTFQPARDLIGTAEPVTEGIVLDLPLMSENGAAVPLGVRVEGAMTPAHHVESLHLFAPQNPSPELASFQFTPLAGRADIQTRVRLNESQTVIAIARMSDGQVRIAEHPIQITTIGCMLAEDDAGDDSMQARVRLPRDLKAGEPAEFLTMISHPMETGLRMDGEGNMRPQRIIEQFSAKLDGAPALTASLYRSVSANPYLRFYLAPAGSAELTLEWVEDTGRTVVETARLTVS